MYNMKKKYLMTKTILNIIRISGPISRTKIRNIIKGRMATIIDIVNELLEEGIVIESGKINNKIIKKKKLLCINDNIFKAIGISIEAEEIIGIVANLNGTIIKKFSTCINADYSKGEILINIFNLIDKLKDGIKRESILGIGIANLGILNKEKDRIIFSSQLPKWKNVFIKDLIEEKSGFKVYVDEIALLELMGEEWFGEIGNYKNIIYIRIGSGIGISIISDGHYVRGASGIAGEIAHTFIVPDGEPCYCGSYGCLQTVASSKAIISKVKKLLSSGSTSLISDMVEGDLDRIGISEVIEAAIKYDKISLRVLDEAIRYLGIGISNAVNLLNPELIIFGGKMIDKTGYLIEPIERMISKYALQLASRDIVYKSVAIKENGGALGAVAMVLNDYFKHYQLQKMRAFSID